MTFKGIYFLSTLTLVCALGGCASGTVGFEALGSHTLRVAADQEVDVVWLLKDEGITGSSQRKQTILRCHNSEQGPLCEPARIPQ